MGGNGERMVAGLELGYELGFDDEVFFIVRDDSRVGQIDELASIFHWRVGGDRLRSDIERDAVVARPADGARQHRHGRLKAGDVRIPVAVAGVVQDERAGRALDAIVLEARVDRKSRRPAEDKPRRGQSLKTQFEPKCTNPGQQLADCPLAIIGALVLVMTIVNVETSGKEARQPDAPGVELRRFRPDGQTGAILPDVEIEQKVASAVQPAQFPGQLTARFQIVGNHCELRFGELVDQAGEESNVRPHERISQQDIVGAALRQKGRFRNRCALVLANAEFQFHSHDFARLVRLDMGPQSVRRTRDIQGRMKIGANDIRLHQERRRRNRLGLAQMPHRETCCIQRLSGDGRLVACRLARTM